jgi:hypothetical protein
MANLGRKLISVGETRRYTIDYDGFLEATETLASFVFTVTAGPATCSPVYSIAGDGKSVIFYVTGASAGTPSFNVNIEAHTSLAQIKEDHAEFEVVGV